MNKKSNMIFVVLSTLLLSSCQSFGPTTSQIDRDGIDIVSSNSAQKLAYIKTLGNKEIFCAPREGDIADTYSSGASLGLAIPGKTDDVSDSNSQGAVSLGGRNPEVLLARELLFRACELASNTNANGEQTIKIYSLFLDKMIELSRSTSGTGTQSVSSTPQPITNQIFSPQMNPSSTNTNSSNGNSSNGSNSSNNTGENGNSSCDPAIDWNCDPGKK